MHSHVLSWHLVGDVADLALPCLDHTGIWVKGLDELCQQLGGPNRYQVNLHAVLVHMKHHSNTPTMMLRALVSARMAASLCG